MQDAIFGELLLDEEYDWWSKKQTIDFGGTPTTVEILIDKDKKQTEVSEKQHKTFQRFMEKWPELQGKLIDDLIEYYNEDQRFAWGPDDEEEFDEWWPEIETKEALLNAVTLESILIRPDFLTEDDEHSIYLLFSRTWGGDDDDDNGIGVHILNEEIEEIAYKDIAF